MRSTLSDDKFQSILEQQVKVASKVNQTCNPSPAIAHVFSGGNSCTAIRSFDAGSALLPAGFGRTSRGLTTDQNTKRRS